MLPNIVTKPKPYFLNVRWSNSSSKTDRISKNHQNLFASIMDTNGDGFISTEEFVEDIPKRFAAIVAQGRGCDLPDPLERLDLSSKGLLAPVERKIS